MSVSSITSNSNLNQSDWQNNFQQLRKEFEALAGALQSGDLTGAQNAFADLQKLQPSSSPANSAQTNGQGGGQLAADFKALGDALQKGDMDSARTAFAKLQQDAQSIHHHRHHRHHASGTQDAGSNAATTLTNSTGSTSSGDNSTSTAGKIDITV
jgi:hypothetical protein